MDLIYHEDGKIRGNLLFDEEGLKTGEWKNTTKMDNWKVFVNMKEGWKSNWRLEIL